MGGIGEEVYLKVDRAAARDIQLTGQLLDRFRVHLGPNSAQPAPQILSRQTPEQIARPSAAFKIASSALQMHEVHHSVHG